MASCTNLIYGVLRVETDGSGLSPVTIASFLRYLNVLRLAFRDSGHFYYEADMARQLAKTRASVCY